MRYYETLYLINPNLSNEDYSGMVAKYNNLIEKNKGVIIDVDEWGTKTLAYEMKKFDKGYYVLVTFCGQGNIIAEIERDMRLDERILQFQTVKLADRVDPEALLAKAAEKKQRAESGEVPQQENTEETGKSE